MDFFKMTMAAIAVLGGFAAIDAIKAATEESKARTKALEEKSSK